MLIRHACLAAVCILASACSAAPEAAETEPSGSHSATLDSGPFIDARSYFTEPDDIDSWYALTRDLKAQFDSICGDSFCEGDYSNYESLGMRCSVQQSTGKMGRCLWTFAASTEEIRSDNGGIRIHGRIWKCPMPIVRRHTIHELVRALSASGVEALHSAVPGSTQSFYDGLIDCL
jgi:hypothetical protein